MKTCCALLLVMLFAWQNGFSQDLIITTQKDTIRCKIKKVTKKAIVFNQSQKNVVTTGEISVSDVSQYTFGVIPSTEKKIDQPRAKAGFSRFRFGVGGGLGYVYASSKKAEEQLVDQGFSNDKVKSYYNGLRPGLLGEADVTYLVSPEWGIGLKYKFFNNSNSMDGYIDLHDGVNLLYGKLSENIYVNFVGATFYMQQPVAKSNGKLKFNAAYSIGMATYRDEMDAITNCYLINSKRLALDLNFGLEYYIAKNITLGANLSGFYSMLHKAKLSDGTNSVTQKLDKDQYENISRIDLSFGIHIYR